MNDIKTIVIIKNISYKKNNNNDDNFDSGDEEADDS